MTECAVVIVALTGVLIFFVWDLKRFQEYHLKRVLELLGEKHEVEKEVDTLKRENFELGLKLVHSESAIERERQRAHHLEMSVRAAQNDLQEVRNNLDRLMLEYESAVLENVVKSTQEDAQTPKGPPRLQLITEED